MESEYLKAEKKALELIARAEQCSAGLMRKLEMRGHKPEIAAQIISNLTEQKLIDDSRYARIWLQRRVRLVRTPRRLLAGLCSRGIPKCDAQAALAAVFSADNGGEELELAMLKRFAAKQAKKAARKGETDFAALKYLLKSEGFSKEAIEQFFQSGISHHL